MSIVMRAFSSLGILHITESRRKRWVGRECGTCGRDFYKGFFRKKSKSDFLANLGMDGKLMLKMGHKENIV
jgi:hypothetical protein